MCVMCQIWSGMWNVELNYVNCLWSPTVANHFQCLCVTVLNLYIEGKCK